MTRHLNLQSEPKTLSNVRENASHNDARHRRTTPTTRPTPTAMSSNATHATDTPTEGGIATHAHQINAQEAFLGLPEDVNLNLNLILRSDTDPNVLARLRAVSRAMRDAVDTMGLQVGELKTARAAEIGCLDTLQHKLQKGRLKKSEVCHFAAKGGQLEVLQWARANGCPWNANTCLCAA